MKRVMFLYHTSAVGGGSYCLLNILKNLNREIIEPIVILCDQGPLVREIERIGINVVLLNGMHTVPYNVSTFRISRIKNALRIINSMRVLKTIISKIKPDVVYCNTMMLYPYLRPAKKCACKTIIHIREHWQEGEHKWQRNVALKHIAKYADEIIAINKYSASMVEPYGRKATVVYDWIDMSRRYEEMPLENIFGEDMADKKTFLFLGGGQPIKGALEVLNAFTKELLNPNYRLLALGISTEHNDGIIRAFIKRVMKLFGKKTYRDKVIDMVNSDHRIACLPSNYNIRHLFEQAYCIVSYFTIPHANLALAESIICHTMNVAAKNDESMEYSIDGQMALLFEENNYDDFIHKLKSLPTVRDLYLRRMVDYSHIISEMFDPDTNIKKLNSILNTL